MDQIKDERMKSVDIYKLKKDYSGNFDRVKDSEHDLNEKEVDERIKELVQLLASRDYKTRLNAAKEIVKFRRKALNHLTAGLKYGDRSVKEGVILALAEIGRYDLAQLMSLLSDEDEDIRAGAVLALGLLDGKEVVEHIVNSLRDESSLVRFVASKTLSSLESLEPLIPLLQSGDWRIKYGVSRALEDAGERAIKPLLKAIAERKDSEDSNQQLAKMILLEIAKKSPECLLNTFRDAGDLGLVAFEVLLNLDEEFLYEYLTKLMHHDDKRIRESAIGLISALENVGSKKLAKVLVDALDDDSWFVRMVAAEILAIKCSEEGIGNLKKLLNDVEIVRDSVKKLLEDLNHS